MKKIILMLVSCFLIACSGGDSDSGGMVAATLPGTNVPANFAGTYTGTATVTASALGTTETDSFAIIITVSNDAMVLFDGDGETFTVGLSDSGAFAGNLPINEDPCEGSASIEGTVNGTDASGSLSGSGTCLVGGASVDVTLEGTFSANK